MMLLSTNKYPEAEVGGKAIRLQELLKWGYPVPEFVVVPVGVVNLVWQDVQSGASKLLGEVCSEIVEALPQESYAVRSAALVEDGQQYSMAGQFKTVLNVDASALAEAILQVMSDAAQRDQSNLGLSIIIQKFVAAETAGIIFSRNPLGGRELVLECVQGSGEAAVGGQAVEGVTFPLSDAARHTKIFSGVSKLAQMTREIEQRYDWPQDIEWAYTEGGISLLQTRPVTTISDAKWQGIKLVETEVASMSNFYYEQTDLSETFNNPRPLAFSILSSLYQSGGPIEKSYQSLGVKYDAVNQLRLFGNQLFIDKQAEVKSLLPAYGYFKKSNGYMQIESFGGMGVTSSNWFRLARLSTKPSKSLEQRVLNILKSSTTTDSSLVDNWKRFIELYPTLFEINLRAQKALGRLKQVLQKDQDQLVGLLEAESIPEIKFDYSALKGNSLSIDDQSEFQVTDGYLLESNSDKKSWLDSQPAWRKRGLQKYIVNARYYNNLREQARWASVRLMSDLRVAVELMGKQAFAQDSSLVYFTTIDELLNNTLDEIVCRKRQEKYLANTKIVAPRVVCSFSVKQPLNEISVLSPGNAVGTLVTIENLREVEGDKILYTEVLSPDLTAYFDMISGIVTAQGGLLSHLAIMARERGLPVIISSNPPSLGRQVQIDGSKLINL